MDIVKKMTSTIMSGDGQISKKETHVVSEHTLNVIINEQFIYRLVCTNCHLKELVIGRLVTDGMIKKKDNISDVILCGNENEAQVLFNSEIPCVKIPSRDKLQKLPECDLKSEWVFMLAEEFGHGAPIHDQTGTSHICILGRKGKILFKAEDIGRHNAVDKAVGYAVLNDIPLSECMIFISGRVPVDMVEKVIAAGIPVLVSKSVPTAESVELAEEYNLKLICKAWPDQYEMFTN